MRSFDDQETASDATYPAPNIIRTVSTIGIVSITHAQFQAQAANVLLASHSSTIAQRPKPSDITAQSYRPQRSLGKPDLDLFQCVETSVLYI
jgi:hypothetical protein